MAIPATAAAAYQALAKIGTEASAQAGTGTATGSAAQSFGDFLASAVKDSISTMKQGETMAIKQIAGQADIVDVVNAVNQAELTLNTVVAVRDKIIQAYQSIMQMPI